MPNGCGSPAAEDDVHGQSLSVPRYSLIDPPGSDDPRGVHPGRTRTSA
jgi:hypothetical protein